MEETNHIHEPEEENDSLDFHWLSSCAPYAHIHVLHSTFHGLQGQVRDQKYRIKFRGF